MKKFEELNTTELVNLTDDQIEFYKKFAAMTEGVVKPAPFTPQVLPEIIKPETEYFKVGEVLFKDRETAYDFIKLNPMRKASSYEIGWRFDFAELMDMSVTVVKVYDKDALYLHIEELKLYQTIKDANEAGGSEYRTALKQYEKVVSAIDSKIESAKEVVRLHERIVRCMEEFVELAGDAGIARKFLRQRYGNNDINDAFRSQDVYLDMIGFADED